MSYLLIRLHQWNIMNVLAVKKRVNLSNPKQSTVNAYVTTRLNLNSGKGGAAVQCCLWHIRYTRLKQGPDSPNGPRICPSTTLMIRFYQISSTIKEIKHGSVKNLAHALFIKRHAILPSVPDLATAILLLSLPVTDVSAGRSLPKLKLIKTHLRSTTAQETLTRPSWVLKI